ncbi:NADH-quinone oxidoreductase subunit C [Streptomyces vietnamensis]|uniref:NADH-quinone oxidoreductase subunit C n=1 Tax=Streptomyces vietnamensis TaxID=362257 RepID=UPI0037B473CA
MNRYDSLPDSVTEIFGEEATAEQAYDLLTVDVPPASWVAALTTARDELGCTYFDWLSAVDEPGTGFRVCAHVVALGEGAPKRLLLRTTVPHEAPVLPTAIGVYAGAGWHERETHEMFGVAFEGHPHLVPLLLPENFEGHPLRKDFVLAARVAKAWPGAKEPGESHDGGGPKRRQMLPPGVPDPNEWGPLKGQLPPAPARPARAAAGERPARAAAGERPVRRARSVTEGSASQAAPEPGATAEAPATEARPPRRTRSAADGSASQATPVTPEPEASAADGPAPRAAATPRTRSSDAPWHHARPAFDEDPAAPKPPTTPATPAAAEPAEAPAPDAPGPDAASGQRAEEPGATEAPAPEAPAPQEAPAPASDASGPGPDAPAPAADAPASGPVGPVEPAAPGPEAPASDAARTAEGTPAEGGPAEPPAGRDGTDTDPTDPAGGDPA